MICAYADPPYYGMGRRLYADHHPEASDWDDQGSMAAARAQGVLA